METSSSSLESILEAAGLRSVDVDGNPYLAGGFLMVTSLLGLLVIIGVFWYHRSNLSLCQRTCIMSYFSQENSLMGVHVVQNPVVFLLIVDTLNLIVGIILGAEMVTLSCSAAGNCFYVEVIWFLSRWFGMFIHLVNASLCIYNLHQPLSAARVCIAYLLVSVVIIIIVPLYLFVTKVAIFILAAFIFLFALLVIVASIASTSPPSTANLKKLIVAVAMWNFLVVYVPTFIHQCLFYSSGYDEELVNYPIIYVLVFTNFHLIFDGLQCALVLKLLSGEEQQQQLGFQNPGYTASTNVNEQ